MFGKEERRKIQKTGNPNRPKPQRRPSPRPPSLSPLSPARTLFHSRTGWPTPARASAGPARFPPSRSCALTSLPCTSAERPTLGPTPPVPADPGPFVGPVPFVTPRPTDSTGEFENLSDEAEELCYSSLFRIYATPI